MFAAWKLTNEVVTLVKNSCFEENLTTLKNELYYTHKLAFVQVKPFIHP